MNGTTIRGNTRGMLILGCILSLILVCFSLCSYYIITTYPTPPGVRIFITLLITLCLFIPGILYLLSSILSYFKKIIITETKVVMVCPFRKKRIIHIDSLSFWGCVAYAPRSSKFFFCTEDRQSIVNYLRSHWDLCKRIFGDNTIDLLKDSEEGLIRLAVGTYLFKRLFRPFHDTFLLDICTTHRLRILVNALKKDALMTGPLLINIDATSPWAKEAKYNKTR